MRHHTTSAVHTGPRTTIGTRWLVAVLAAGPLAGQGQNLVPNPGFESFSNCPVGFSQFSGFINNWVNPNTATPDYMNSCANPQPAGVPHNGVGWQQPHAGNGYVGMYAFSGTLYREFIQVQLTTTLTAGVLYDFHMYVVLHNRSQTAIDDIGAYLSVAQPTAAGTGMLAGSPVPQFSNPPGNVITDTLNWTFVNGTYLATGGEKWLTIGHLKADALTTYQALPYGSLGAYYYYEDVYLAPITALPVELLSFAAEGLADRVRLTWATATEHDNAAFFIERSVGAAEFITLGGVPGHGSSMMEQHYAFDDMEARAGTAYFYRLRQTDLDGRTTYSDVVPASLAQAPFGAVWQPDGHLALTSPQTGTLRLSAFSLDGRLCATEQLCIPAGVSLIDVTPLFPNGPASGPVLWKLSIGSRQTTVMSIQ